MEQVMQHFRADEQAFVEQVFDWVQDVEDQYAPRLTDFLNPRERFIVQSIVGSRDLIWQAEGLFKEAERQRMLIYPSYYEPTLEDYAISAFSVNYPKKFMTIEHPQLLGSLVGLGIDRSKFGDFSITEEAVQFVVVKELADYVQANFNQVGKSKVSLLAITEDVLTQTTDDWEEHQHFVTSMRLDTIVAAAIASSRQKAVSLIKGEKVRVNWTTQTNGASELYEQDLLSIRGAGRFRIGAIEGRTKKDRIRLQIGQIR